MNLKEIAERVGVPLDKAEALVAEIQRQSEAVAYRITAPDGVVTYLKTPLSFASHCTEPLFAFPPDKDQIEQSVAEACALGAIEWGNARKDKFGGHALRNYAEAIRSGDWRKFKKGE